jgi:hypothetical protein
MLLTRSSAAGLAIAGLLGAPALGTTIPQNGVVLPDLSAATFLPGAPVTNPYFPVGPGPKKVLVARESGLTGPIVEPSELSYAGPGREILGVRTEAVLDRAFEGDRLVEETLDYYAQDTAGNVWYFGEDVTNFRYDDRGNFLGTDSESAWIAGVNDALPGWIMPSVDKLDPGLAYYQEFAAADGALDEALIRALGEAVESGGQTFANVLVTFETTVLDPEAREFKYYAPGIGVIRADEGLSPELGDPELIFQLTPVPLPAGLPLLAAALGAIALAGRARPQRRRAITRSPGTGAPSS